MNYDLIRQNYLRGLWSKPMVETAVAKGVITQEECDAILAGRELPGGDSDADLQEFIDIIEGRID